ncbi:uncharacterized protein CANTADRAFT_24865 [Suhomyces tanzawaensis NRRL Y-17324]|uniref:Uncharacterized protein n=1 Tax=Suhomyces tanzawaensis NRRL Y-17324 TaxID=984487 RepID=A0A1E4SS09_9ASCO|nr:uncharacterized protein CANTADRAFT_24865 [Suhomyces tanzawaensis NRRL Y-17324]ODV82291.1 hypothetical protein CANTADRAFT_24865 [Suhomyces tanzawaensis NRRL Y-17324]
MKPETGSQSLAGAHGLAPLGNANAILFRHQRFLGSYSVAVEAVTPLPCVMGRRSS